MRRRATFRPSLPRPRWLTPRRSTLPCKEHLRSRPSPGPRFWHASSSPSWKTWKRGCKKIKSNTSQGRRRMTAWTRTPSARIARRCLREFNPQRIISRTWRGEMAERHWASRRSNSGWLVMNSSIAAWKEVPGNFPLRCLRKGMNSFTADWSAGERSDTS